jgi:crotonobetainyl-CoA:carnitine CoA-transferase CaiB-like acyl-CoA transferase
MDRLDLFERWPGSKYADHARHNRELQRELQILFKTKTSVEWLEFADRVNTAIAPVNTPKTLLEDPQFQDRFPLIPAERLGADQMPAPLKFIGEELPVPEKAPTVGQHNREVMRDLLHYDDAAFATASESGAFG